MSTSTVGAKRYFYERYKELVVSVGGLKTRSTFQDEGKPTPLEYLEAGNALVQKSPMWEWCPGPATYLPALPTDRKYLVMKDVPCKRRVDENDPAANDAGADGDWAVTAKPAVEAAAAQAVVGDDDDDAAVAVVDDEDPDRVTTGAAAAGAAVGSNPFRRYNVYLLYDAFYCTPRVYLSGYNANNQPLTKDEMYEDVFSQNRERTVTVDHHPVLGHPCISIHPCRHAKTMKRNLQRLEERFNDEQEEAGVDAAHRIAFVFPTFLALFVFLRFIASVVPTVEYDVGIDVEN